jgi:hypothetical protein
MAQGHALADEGGSEDGDEHRVLIRPGRGAGSVRHRARLNLSRMVSPLATAAARPAGCGGMLSKGVYKHRKPSVLVGRVASLPVEGEGPSADGRGTGRVYDERAATKRSGCVSPVYPR